jgi:alpha,alpha-trehalase
MAVWTLQCALNILELLAPSRCQEIRDQLGLTDSEISRWQDITRKMRIVFHDDGIISQFEGYAELQEFDWDGYRRKYGNIQRLDRILEAEGDSPKTWLYRH